MESSNKSIFIQNNSVAQLKWMHEIFDNVTTINRPHPCVLLASLSPRELASVSCLVRLHPFPDVSSCSWHVSTCGVRHGEHVSCHTRHCQIRSPGIVTLAESSAWSMGWCPLCFLLPWFPFHWVALLSPCSCWCVLVSRVFWKSSVTLCCSHCHCFCCYRCCSWPCSLHD